MEACTKTLKVDIVKHNALHILHVNLIWALMEDANNVIKELSELRLTHDMNIEDEHWAIDERL